MASAADLPPEQQASYSAIIDKILASSDLNTISAKRIRNGLQEKVEYDITPQKAAITDLIMQRFDKFQRDQENGTAEAAAPEPAPTTNGAAKAKSEEPETSEPTSPTKRKADDDGDDEEMSDVADSPPPKKVKKSAKVETDEELAKRMQAELNAPHARSTRGGGSTTKRKSASKVKKSSPVKKTKKKSKAKINSDDDSDVDKSGSDSEKPAKEKKGGFHKPMHLSPPLSELLGGQAALSRPQTVKQIWAYVREHDLQDPADKRQIRCDEPMKRVFKSDRVHMFTMNKLLASHLHAVDETA